MKYDLSISQHNIKPHLAIEKDIEKKKNGLFTFNLIVSQGNIESYATYETVTREAIVTGFVQELVITRVS